MEVCRLEAIAIRLEAEAPRILFLSQESQLRPSEANAGGR